MIKKNKDLLITFDYELFLGKNSGSIEKCLIEPTEKLIRIFGRHQIKAIFFIDTTYLLQLKKLSATNSIVKGDYDCIVLQIQKLIKCGHWIFPHLHPHWLDAKYVSKTNSWDLSDISRYRMEKLDQETIGELFDKSIELLNDIIKPVIPDYSPEGYRAGGWSIQPFSCFMPSFIKHQIKYDFSIIPGKYHESEAQKFDFKEAPLKPKYSFSNNICQEDASGQFVEFTISTVQPSKFYNYLNGKYTSVLYLLNFPFSKSIGDGETVRPKVLASGDRYSDKNDRTIASFEGLSPIMLFYYLKEISKVNYFHFISHPKMLSRLDFFFLSIFMRILSFKYSIQNDFRKI